MEMYIKPELIDNLILETNLLVHKNDLDIELLDVKISELYKQIDSDLKLLYLADTEYINALRDLKLSNFYYYIDSDIVKGLELLYSQTIKSKLEKQISNLDTSEDDELILKIEKKIIDLKTISENERKKLEDYTSKYGSVADHISKQRSDLELDLNLVQNKVKEHIKSRNRKFLFVAILFYYIGFGIEKIFDMVTPEVWYFSFVSSLLIFILGYLWIDKIKDDYIKEVKIEIINKQLNFLKNKSAKIDAKLKITGRELNLTVEEVIIELALQLDKLSLINQSLKNKKRQITTANTR